MKERLSISVNQAEYQTLQALAKRHDVSMAWLGRQAIAHFLEQYRQKEVQLPLTLKPGMKT